MRRFTLLASVSLISLSISIQRARAVNSPPFKYVGRVERTTTADLNSFGVDVAVNGARAVVGSSTPDFHFAPGSAYVYDFSNPQNITALRLLSGTESMQNLEKFGQSVAISGSLVFVGAPNTNSDAGVVHMFDVGDPLHVTHTVIHAFDEAPQGQFGWSLAVDGDRLVVGSPDFSALVSLPPAVYILDISNPQQITQTKIVPDPSNNVGRFGEYVDIEGDRLLVGDSDDNLAGSFVGAAYLYDLSTPAPYARRTLLPYDPQGTTSFGRGVALSGNVALVHATGDLGPIRLPGIGTGVVYIHDASNWTNVTQKEIGPSVPVNRFGAGMDMNGNIAIIGAATGAFVFDMSDPAHPIELGQLKVPGGITTAGFGATVAFDGQMAIISAPGEKAAYLFALVPEPHSTILAIAAALTLVAHHRAKR